MISMKNLRKQKKEVQLDAITIVQMKEDDGLDKILNTELKVSKYI